MNTRPTPITASFALAALLATAPAAFAEDNVTGPTVSLGAGMIHNFDEYDTDAGTGAGGRLRVGFRTRIGLDPILTFVPLLGLPAHDTVLGVFGAGAAFRVTLGRVEPYVEASALLTGSPVAMVGGGIGYAVAPRWQLGFFADCIFSFDQERSGQPIVLEGLELTHRF